MSAMSGVVAKRAQFAGNLNRRFKLLILKKYQLTFLLECHLECR